MHVYKEVISKVVFYYEISTFDAFCVPVRLTYPIYVIIYCFLNHERLEDI